LYDSLHLYDMNRILLIILLALMLTGCAGEVNDSLLVNSTSTATPPPTPTIVWFPPSATPPPTAFAPQTPTPEQKPGVGAISLTDDFSLPYLWNPASSNEGSAIVSDHHLTLAVPPGSSIFRIREDLVVGDFFAELTASPSLCRDQDEYGLLVRASAVAYYRLVLICNGTLRLDRVSGNSRQILLPAISSGDVPTGTPGEVRMGVWAFGPDLRFFLNGHYQFSVKDGTYLSGTIGAYARSVADTPVAVTFSDLTVYDVNYSPPAKTP
jgi:hypothetical protein